MQPRINNQAASAPHLVAETSELLIGSLVDAHLNTELLAVQRPALAKCTEVQIATELRGGIHFKRQGVLVMMARHSLMQSQ